MAAGGHMGRGGLLGAPPADRSSPGRGQVSHGAGPMRLLGFLGVAIAVVALFAVSTLLAVALHLGTPLGRRLAAEQANAILRDSFQGRLRIDRVGALGLFGLGGTDATLFDPRGRPVLAVRGARVRVATFAAARSALFGKRQPVAIAFGTIAIDGVDVRLDTDPAGKLDLLDALESRTPSPPADPNARGMRIILPRIAIEHGWAHGRIGSAPPLDVHLDDFVGSLTYAADALEGDVSRAAIAARRVANGLDVEGSLRGHVRKPAAATADIDAWLEWEGVMGTSRHSLHASLADGNLLAAFEMPALAPDDLRALWPGSPVDKPAAVHLDARGSLESVAVDWRMALGEATLRVSGDLSIGDHESAMLALDGHDIDVHAFLPSLPTSRLAFKGNLGANRTIDGALRGDLALRLLGGDVGSSRTPAASIHATASRSARGELRASAAAVVEEPSAPTRLTAELAPAGSSTVLQFAVDSNVSDLDALPGLQHTLRGSGRLDAKGSIDLTQMTVDAGLEASAKEIAHRTASVRRATLSARASGAAVNPRVDVAFHATEVGAGKMRFASLDVTAAGFARAPHVAVAARGIDAPDVDATADVGLESGLSLSPLRVALARAGERAIVTADRVDVAGDAFRVDGARVEGLGAPMSLAMAVVPGALRLRASSDGIDLARLGRLAHIEQNLQRGTLSVASELDLRPSGARGQGTIDLSRADLAGVKDVAAHVEMKLEGRQFAGKAHAEAGGIGSVSIRAPNLALGGAGPLSKAGWRSAWGNVSFDAHVDLAKLEAVVPAEQFPFTEAGGEVSIKGHLVRDDLRDPTPDLGLSIVTNRLVLSPKTDSWREIDGVYVMSPPPWRLAGVDFDVDASLDGDTGALNLATQLRDAKGALAQVNASAERFPFDDLLRKSGRFSTDLRETPFDVHLSVPERGLGGLPALLKQNYLTGRLKGELTATGTILAPRVHLAASLRQSRLAGTSRSLPLEFEIKADYDGAHGQASVKGQAAGQELLDAEAQIDAIVAQLLEAGSAAPWRASGRAHLAGFPLDAILFLDDKVVSGQLSGDLSIADLHQDARADVALSADSLSVGTVKYRSATLHAKADGHTIDAAARIDQSDGFAETKAHAPASWGAALGPTLDPASPLEFALSAKNFRIAGLLPFVDRWLDELDGRLDADTSGQLDPKSRQAKLAGRIALSRGALEASAGGGEFHDIAASLVFAPDGVITLEKATASGVTGRVEASGSARLNGMRLEAARGVVVIPSGAPLPISAGGAEIGSVDGRVEISEIGSGESKDMNVKVEVPEMRVALPEGSSTEVQSLGEIQRVRIGAHRGHPLKFVLVPLDPVKKADAPSDAPKARIAVQTHLADVQVVRGTDLKIDLAGNVDVEAGQTTEVTGQIRLRKGGALSVQGKTFRVESGTVTFVGDDPSNPQVVVKAGWTAPDGTVVYANFVGPLRTGKVTLTSEPPLSQQEIAELLLFGTAGGRQAQSSSTDPTNSAIGTVGGEAAQPLNHALNQMGLGAFTAKVDTSDASSPKPEVAVQIARDISIQIGVVLGQPPPGVNPDRTLLTVDWRFLSRWSLSSTLGDAGTTIFDVLWQRRY
jgi:translocation and assembly module TamB